MISVWIFLAVSLSMPIVYHLHTSGKYNHRPSTSPSRPPGQPRDAEADKAAFVKDVLIAGLMPQPWLVKADLATDKDQRSRLAMGSQKWHELIVDLRMVHLHDPLHQLLIREVDEVEDAPP